MMLPIITVHATIKEILSGLPDIRHLNVKNKIMPNIIIGRTRGTINSVIANMSININPN